MRIFHFILWIILSTPFYAQEEVYKDTVETEKAKVDHFGYGSVEIRIGTYNGVGCGFNYVYNEEFSLRLEMVVGLKRAENTPSDYSTGLNFAPRDGLFGVQLLGGMIFDLSGNGKVRMNFQVGGGYYGHSETTNWEKNSVSGVSNLLYENYNYEQVHTNFVGFVLAPRFEFAFIPFFGVTFTPTMMLSKHLNYFGVQIGIMGGKIRRKTKR